VPTIELGWRTEEVQACFHQADAGSWPANIVNMWLSKQKLVKHFQHWCGISKTVKWLCNFTINTSFAKCIVKLIQIIQELC